MGLVIDTSDGATGIVSATAAQDPDIHITVSVQAYGAGKVLVRAHGEHFRGAISDSKPYQPFFAALEHTLNMQAQELDSTHQGIVGY